MSQASKNKTWLKNTLRIIVCIAALCIVLRSVTLYDHVRIVGDDGGVHDLKGRIIAEDPIELVDVDGNRHVIPQAGIARRADGEPDKTYGLYTVLRRANKWLILLAVFFFTPGTLIQGKRFQWVLRAQDIRIRYLESLKLCWIGNFLNFLFAVGATAGDLFRMYQVAKRTERRTEAVLSVLLDRFTGLIGLVLLVAVISLLSPADGPLGRFRWFTIVFLVVGGAAAFVYLSPMTRALVPKGWIQRVPKIDYLRRIDRTALNCAKHKMLTIGAILSTVALQLFCIGSYVIGAVALGFPVDGFKRVFEFFAYFGAGWVVATIPVSIQGMGTMELAYKEMFAPYGPVNAILCLAFAVRLIQLVVSLPGGVLFFVGAYHLPTETEVKEIEIDLKGEIGATAGENASGQDEKVTVATES